MTLVYAKIINMCREWGWGWGLGAGGPDGYLKFSKTGSNTYIALCRGWGVYVCTYVFGIK